MKSRKARKTTIERSKVSHDRRMVWIDQEPLRQEASQHCQREIKRMEKAREQWSDFQEKDKPAYERWMAATFGALMSEIRELAGKLQTHEALIMEVESEMFVGGWHSYGAAYAALCRRKEAEEREKSRYDSETPPQFGKKNAEPRGIESDEEGAHEPTQFEQEFLFEQLMRDVLGIDPDRMSDREYQKRFREFQQKVFGKDEEYRSERGALEEMAPAEERPVNVRVKEVYRVLVRRLHPDTRADSDAKVSALWHDVQQAYADGNLERLEMLLAMTDLQEEIVGAHTTLSQMRAVLKELRRSYQALQRCLAAARKELAWNFRNADHGKLEGKLRKRMDMDCARLREQCAEAESFIGSWTEPKRTRSKAGRRSQRGPQSQFAF